MSSYPKAKVGQKVKINTEKEILRLACCDCGLVHQMDIEIDQNENGVVYIVAPRNERATAQLRRYKYGFLHDKNNGTKWRLVRNAD